MTETLAPTPRRTSPLVMLLLILLPSAAIFAGLYYTLVHKPAQENRKLHETLMSRIVGLSGGGTTAGPSGTQKLAAAYTDANADLLADPPAEAKLVDPDTLIFSWIPDDDTVPLRDAFKDLTDRLAIVTGKRIIYALEIKSTEDQLRALRDGKLHVTGFSTGAVPVAVNLAGFIPVGMLAGDEAGAGSQGGGKHRMQIIVPASSPIQTVADLREHDLALTEPTSNSGFRAPIVLLRNEHNLLPARDYQIINTRTYEASINGIAKKELQAAAVASDVLDRAVAAGKIKKADYRVLFSSPEFPSAAIGYAHNLKPDLAGRVRRAILEFSFKNTSLEPRFASSNQTRFVPLNYKNDWAVVRLIDDSLARPYQLK
jgi:phosphonate transport system substrate-binding protein